MITALVKKLISAKRNMLKSMSGTVFWTKILAIAHSMIVILTKYLFMDVTSQKLSLIGVI
jgi:hypothetical protein